MEKRAAFFLMVNEWKDSPLTEGAFSDVSPPIPCCDRLADKKFLIFPILVKHFAIPLVFFSAPAMMFLNDDE